MTEVEGEGVAIVADSITLKAITLLLVRDMKFDPAPSLKSKRLLINTQPLTWNPHLCCVVIQLVKEMLHLPQRILCRLLLCVFVKVEHAHKTLEVLPPSEASDGLPSPRELLVHRLCNEVITKDLVWLEPHINSWARQKAIQEQEPDHLVDLSRIKRFIIFVDCASKTSTLYCSSCIGCVDHAPLDKLR
jgi:hypothetical protein